MLQVRKEYDQMRVQRARNRTVDKNEILETEASMRLRLTPTE
jgi:hypothetical protein